MAQNKAVFSSERITMARARNIKPALFKNEVLGQADPLYTLLFQSLWLLADREGRLEDRPMRIKAETFPYRDGLNVDAMLSWLHENGFIVRYSSRENPNDSRENRYIQVVNFSKHQNPHKNEAESIIPCLSNGCTASEKIGTTSEKIGSAPADSLNLIPDSLNLIPDSPPTPQGGEEDEIPADWKADTRTMRAMPLDWTPDANTLNTYLQGKAANGRPVTVADVTARLGDWRENANASGKTMTDAQWTLRLVKYVMACMTSDSTAMDNRQQANQPDPLAFTEENRPERGPYALFKPGPKKTPMTDEGRAMVEQLRRQAFGDAA